MLEAVDPTPLRVLFVSSLPRWGGRERWIVQAASGLAARGHDVHVVARPSTKVLARAAEAGLHTRAVRTQQALDPRTLVAMRQLLRDHQPHAVFVQLDRELAALALAGWGATRPLVFQKRAARRAHHPALQRSFLSRRVTRTLTNSEHARDWLVTHAGFAAAEVQAVRDGVTLEPVAQPTDRTALRRSLKLPRKPKLVLHVGMLEPGKGQDTTLRALAALAASRPDAVPTVAFLGTGPEEARLHDLCHQLGVRPHVEWVGFRTNVTSYLACADVLVHPSTHDGLSWTILEAMAQRLPIVAADLPGQHELLRHGHNAVLVPPGDPAALAGAVRDVLDDAPRAAERAARAWETVCDDWSLDAMLDDLESLVYAHLLRRQQQDAAQRAALFVDRDDTLIRDLGDASDPEQVELLPGAARALRWVCAAGLRTVLVSNQGAVARGRITEADVRAVNARVDALLRRAGGGLDGMYWCPHHPEYSGPCTCRKPEPGLLQRAADELGLDLATSLSVGNAQRDLEAGRRAGTASVGFAAAGVVTDLPDTAPTYRSWTRLVRDFLQQRAESAVTRSG